MTKCPVCGLKLYGAAKVVTCLSCLKWAVRVIRKRTAPVLKPVRPFDPDRTIGVIPVTSQTIAFSYSSLRTKR